MKSLYLFIVLSLIYFSSAFIEFQDPVIHPELFEKNLKSKLEIIPPHVYGGDEPHYILMINSLIDDFDLDLKNNYFDLEFPDENRTNLYRFQNIGLGTFKDIFVINNKIIYWTGTLDMVLIRDKGGWRFTEYAKGLKLDQAKLIPMTSPFLSLSLFPFLFPFKSFKTLIEPITIICSIIFSLIGLFFLLKILYYFDKKNAKFITLCFALATPLWVYSQTYYTEAYLWPLLLITFYYFVIKNQNFLPGLFIAYGLLIKETFLITMFPYLIYRLYKKEYKQLIIFIIPILIGLLILFGYYYFSFGQFFYHPVTFIYGNIFKGIYTLFFNLKYGLLIFSPFLIFSLFGIVSFFKLYKKEALISSSLFLIWLFLFASTIGTLEGGLHYSARYLVAILPLLAFPTLIWYNKNKSLFLKIIFFLLLIISIFINLGGVLSPFLTWGHPPWNLPFILF